MTILNFIPWVITTSSGIFLFLGLPQDYHLLHATKGTALCRLVASLTDTVRQQPNEPSPRRRHCGFSDFIYWQELPHKEKEELHQLPDSSH